MLDMSSLSLSNFACGLLSFAPSIDVHESNASEAESSLVVAMEGKLANETGLVLMDGRTLELASQSAPRSLLILTRKETQDDQ